MIRHLWHGARCIAFWDAWRYVPKAQSPEEYRLRRIGSWLHLGWVILWVGAIVWLVNVMPTNRDTELAAIGLLVIAVGPQWAAMIQSTVQGRVR